MSQFHQVTAHHHGVMLHSPIWRDIKRCPLALAAWLALAPAVSPAAPDTDPAGRSVPATPVQPDATAELDALDLADKATPDASTNIAAGVRGFAEVAVGSQVLHSQPDVNSRRLSLDFRYDARWTPTLRAVLSNRLDLVHSDAVPPAQNVNTLREAYISWLPDEQAAMDFGRMNVRQGVALGYNPTDWFKSGAVRSLVSPDPSVLRDNRQGTVALRGQQIWDGGALTAVLSPKLASGPDAGRYSLDTGSTNPRHRWLVTGSHRISDRLTPQWLLHGGNGQAMQVGMNLSALAGDATTVYAEMAVGHGPTLIDKALTDAKKGHRRTRASLGFTHSTPFNLMLSVEAQANSAAPSRTQWRALNPSERLAVLSLADQEQDLVSRLAWFVHAQWKDLVIPRVDIAGYWRHDVETSRDEGWLEIRYRGDRLETALQWQIIRGFNETVVGTIPQARSLELRVRFYF